MVTRKLLCKNFPRDFKLKCNKKIENYFHCIYRNLKRLLIYCFYEKKHVIFSRQHVKRVRAEDVLSGIIN